MSELNLDSLDLHSVEVEIEKAEAAIRKLNADIIEHEASKRRNSLQVMEFRAKKEDDDTAIKVLSRRLQIEHSGKRSLEAKKWELLKR